MPKIPLGSYFKLGLFNNLNETLEFTTHSNFFGLLYFFYDSAPAP